MPAVIGLAQQAAQAILDIYQDHDVGITYKEDESPLTRADLASHEIITHGLSQLTPDIPVVSEESRSQPDNIASSPQVWVVDPVDGTKEFIKRNGEFTVNIALVERGEPILGVVFAPVLNLYYQAIRGAGAQRCDIGKDSQMSCSSLRVRPLATPLTVAASRSHGGKRTQKFLKKLGKAYDLTIHSRGSALKPCLVAEGSADIYPRFGKTMAWDTAAPQCIVEEAGGMFCDFQGRPLRYDDPHARNPSFVVYGDKNLPWQKFVDADG